MSMFSVRGMPSAVSTWKSQVLPTRHTAAPFLHGGARRGAGAGGRLTESVDTIATLDRRSWRAVARQLLDHPRALFWGPAALCLAVLGVSFVFDPLVEYLDWRDFWPHAAVLHQWA